MIGDKGCHRNGNALYDRRIDMPLDSLKDLRAAPDD